MNESTKTKPSTSAKYQAECQKLLESGIDNRERFREAVKRHFRLLWMAKGVMGFAKILANTAKGLGEAAAAYAVDHKTALDVEALSELKTGILNGVVEIDGSKYRLTISRGDPVRIDGGNITQEFLMGLPKAWSESKLELYKSALAKVTEDELREKGLERALKRVWSTVENGENDPLDGTKLYPQG